MIYIDKFFKRRIDKNEERHNFQGSLTLAYRYASRGDVVPQDQMACGKVNNLLYPFSKKDKSYSFVEKISVSLVTQDGIHRYTGSVFGSLFIILTRHQV